MGWIYFHDTVEFLGDLPEGSRAEKRKAMVKQIEKSHPGTFENFEIGKDDEHN